MIGDLAINGGSNISGLEQFDLRPFEYDRGAGQVAGGLGEMISPGMYRKMGELGIAGLRALGPTADAAIYNYLQRSGGMLGVRQESGGINNAGRNELVDFSIAENVPPGFYRANPSQLRFSQSDASPFFSNGGTIDSLVTDLRSGKVFPEQIGDPLQVVMYGGKPFSIDNRRLVSFNQAGVNDVPIQVMSLKDPVAANRFFSRFDPIRGEGFNIVITPSLGRTAAQQLLKDYGLIRGVQLGN